MSPRAVLDACVLVPYNLASLLLTLAEHNLFEPRWSATIFEETHRALTSKIGLHEELAAHRLNAMEQAFPEAGVVGYEVHVEGLTCHPKRPSRARCSDRQRRRRHRDLQPPGLP